MKTTTIRELRHDTTTVLGWVTEGQSVEVQRRGVPVAVISPLKERSCPEMPDFLGRIRAIYGDDTSRCTATELISEARGER